MAQAKMRSQEMVEQSLGHEKKTIKEFYVYSLLEHFRNGFGKNSYDTI